ncbi:MAG TPA: c-type cytochrome [Gemmatimonadaceae bacterium]|jgi:mono/diheme cytochrome c family protein|nr:c-type cytochrome [Gemmatimonadaceae bacterium]
MNDARLAYILGVAGISLLAAACGGEKANHMQGSNTTSTAAPAAAPTPSTGAPAGSTAAGGAVAGSTAAPGAAAGTTSAAGAPGAAAGGGAAQGGGAGSITAAQVAEGDSIFHGQTAGGTCFTCHGPNAKGTALAPDLSDKVWIDGDGTYNYLVQRVTTGVPQPKQYPAPMPPKGGANLSDAQVRAVAAYVYSLSHPDVGKK